MLDFAESKIWERTKEEVFREINNMHLPLVLIGRSGATDPVFLDRIHVPVEYVCSNTPSTWGTQWWGKMVISPMKIPEIYPEYNALILAQQFQKVLSSQLNSLTIPPRKIFALDMHFEEVSSTEFLKSVHSEIERIHACLADQVSRETYETVLQYRINRDTLHLNSYVLPVNEQYYPAELGGKPFLGEEEIFVDIGAYTGDSVKQFLKATSGKYNHIYAFEPDEANFNILEENVRSMDDVAIYQIGIGNTKKNTSLLSKGTGSIVTDKGDCSIQIDTLDNVLKDIPVTYIKMDIEGMESAALHGAKEIIQKYKPKLAVCIYHSDRDMVNIPQLIMSLNSDYKLYIRHYTNSVCETVCYAI